MEDNKCPNCGVNEATEPHTCPYEEQIHGDRREICTCCEDCEYDCNAEI